MSTRFGLLGTGAWADATHAAGLAAHPNVEFVGVWGRDGDKAAAVAERHGTRAEPDLDALLDRVDAVAIALRPDVQAELACRAADAGCHLLLEKPLALSVDAGDRVVAAAERAGVASAVFFTHRFLEPTASWLREVIVPAEWHGADVKLMVSAETGDGPGYDALWGATPHPLSLILPALGPVEEVVAEPGHDDVVALTLRHVGGGVSSTTVGATVPEAANRWSVEFWGPLGIVRPPDLDGDRISTALADAYQRAINDLLLSIETGAASACDVHFAADVGRVIAAAERFIARPGRDRGERP